MHPRSNNDQDILRLESEQNHIPTALNRAINTASFEVSSGEIPRFTRFIGLSSPHSLSFSGVSSIYTRHLSDDEDLLLPYCDHTSIGKSK